MRAIGVFIGAWIFFGQVVAPSEWEKADVATVRLSPSRFTDLPPAVRVELDRRRCSVPQPYTARPDRPVNAIRGRFTSSTATDWAVVCSQQQRSTLLVFRSDGVAKVDELAAGDDKHLLQTTGPGQVGYSRGIFVASPADIRRHHTDADPPLPVLDHDGIDDAFIGKASVIWYWSVNRWLQLSGRDAPALPALRKSQTEKSRVNSR